MHPRRLLEPSPQDAGALYSTPIHRIIVRPGGLMRGRCAMEQERRSAPGETTQLKVTPCVCPEPDELVTVTVPASATDATCASVNETVWE